MRLKHFLSVFLTLLTLSVGQMWGADYTLTALSTPTAASADGFTFTFGKNSGTDPVWNANNSEARVYVNGYFTISHSTATITRIVYTLKQNQGGSSNKAYPTGYSFDATNSSTASFTVGTSTSITWEGSASSVKLTVNGSKGNYGFKSVAITYSSSYTVVWTINPAAGGSLSATSGTSTTVTPTSTYTYGNPAYSVTSGTASVLQSTNTFTATPSANCTIRINMVEKPKYTVTLKDDNSTITQTTINGSITLPSRTGCSGYTFAGWTKSWTSTQSSWTTTAPTIIPAGSYTPTADENLYPVYTKTETGGTSTKTIAGNSITGFGSGTNYTSGSYDAGGGFSISSNSAFSTTQFRVAKSKTLTIASSNSMTEIEFQVSATDYKLNADGITWSSTTGTYTNNSGTTSVTFTNSNANIARITQVKIKYTGGTTTSYTSVPDCCTELASINGSVLRTHF